MITSRRGSWGTKELENVRRKHRKTAPPGVVLFSPDVDLCFSLRLLLGIDYQIMTTTDPRGLSTLVRSFRPCLVIVDGFPGDAIPFAQLDVLRKEQPNLKVIVFFTALWDYHCIRREAQKVADAVFAKPIDLVEVTSTIEQLIEESRVGAEGASLEEELEP